ncbi:MAG: sugar phosphate isomerase/epimerase [Parcubacteria group bacterium]|nr:sugar phosphate isomerase/epimerase [Parcubacteria group bacterium]
MRLLLSSYSLAPFPLEEIFLLAKEIGADGLELVLTPAIFKLGLDKAQKLSDTHQLPIVNIHQPPWYVLFTGKRGVLRFVEIARQCGSQNVVVHLATVRRGFNSGFFEWVKGVEGEKGVSIAFENAAPRMLEKFPRYPGHHDQLEKFIKTRKVNMTLDVAKAVLAGIDPYQFFQRNRDQIKVIHIHGFTHQGDFHVGCLGGEFDWVGFMSFVKKFDWPGAVTLEIFPLHKWVHFGLPKTEALDCAKEIIHENFRLLQRA